MNQSAYNKCCILFVVILLKALFPCVGLARVVFVSSSRGNDFNNDGIFPESPMRTIKAAQMKGDTLYLAAGDVFYEYVELKNKVMTRYGEGQNPVLNGFRTLLGHPWKEVGNCIWKIELTKVITTGYVVKETSLLNNIGCLYETDKDLLHGRKCFSIDDLHSDWDFYQTDLTSYLKDGAKSFDELYLYYSGNPNHLCLALSLGSHYGITLTDSSVISVNVVGFGNGGMTLYGSSNVRNCRIDVCGGSLMLGGKQSVCLGNGIDFWISRDAYNCVIEGNYISRCYDCGCSIQGSGHEGATPRNIIFYDNLISHCCQGWEDFLQNGEDVMFENCRFEKNFVVYSGDSGFGYPSSRFKFCNVLGNNYKGDRGMIISNNTFVGGNYYCSGRYNQRYKSNIWLNNKHYVTRGAYIIGDYSGVIDVVRIPVSGSCYYAINKYRELTGDQTTKFKVRSEKRIQNKSISVINKYLITHSY